MTAKVDSEKRVTLPQANPGEIFSIEERGNDQIVLTRVNTSQPTRRMTRAEVEEGLKKWTAKSKMSWEELRAMTRE